MDARDFTGPTQKIQDNLRTLKSAYLFTGCGGWEVNVFGAIILPVARAFWTPDSRGRILSVKAVLLLGSWVGLWSR